LIDNLVSLDDIKIIAKIDDHRKRVVLQTWTYERRGSRWAACPKLTPWPAGNAEIAGFNQMEEL
jgi:hypothetical protein